MSPLSDAFLALACASCGGVFLAERRSARFCSPTCRVRNHRQQKQPPPSALVRGSNADLIAAAVQVHLPAGARVADLTYGRGVFWQRCPWVDVIGSDLHTVPERPYDFRSTPYDAASFDVVVFDPPYAHTGKNNSQAMICDQYQLHSIKGYSHADVMGLYREGMAEAVRIVRRGGQVWVKCKDEIESGRQRWAHLLVQQMADELGLRALDLLILEPHGRMVEARWEKQHHLRKNHSFLWVFKVPTRLLR
jgi:hypothetical protein